jgi:hypothetical protein
VGQGYVLLSLFLADLIDERLASALTNDTLFEQEMNKNNGNDVDYPANISKLSSSTHRRPLFRLLIKRLHRRSRHPQR